MEKEVPVQVTTLNEFMEWAAQFNHGAHLFRGVPKAEYEMSASAYRRLKQTEDGDESMDEKFEKFLQINGGLIRDVRLRRSRPEKRAGTERFWKYLLNFSTSGQPPA